HVVTEHAQPVAFLVRDALAGRHAVVDVEGANRRVLAGVRVDVVHRVVVVVLFLPRQDVVPVHLVQVAKGRARLLGGIGRDRLDAAAARRSPSATDTAAAHRPGGSARGGDTAAAHRPGSSARGGAAAAVPGAAA